MPQTDTRVGAMVQDPQVMLTPARVIHDLLAFQGNAAPSFCVCRFEAPRLPRLRGLTGAGTACERSSTTVGMGLGPGIR